jgi:signal transduction histidine kinase
LTFVIIHNADGEILGAMANVREITERYQRERELRNRLKELEDQVAELGGMLPSHPCFIQSIAFGALAQS